MLFKKIIVPVDGSEHSLKAAKYARGIARTQNSQLILFHCYGHIPTLIGGSHREQLVRELEEESRKVLQPFHAIFKESNVPFTEAVAGGTPGDAVCNFADEQGADLVVLGSRGMSDLEGLVLGSVSHTVIHRCKSPVLVIR